VRFTEGDQMGNIDLSTEVEKRIVEIAVEEVGISSVPVLNINGLIGFHVVIIGNASLLAVKFEQEFRLGGDILGLEQVQEFFLKGGGAVVFFLPVDVVGDLGYLVMTAGEAAITCLPFEFPGKSSLLIQEFGGVGFDVAYELGYRSIRFITNQQVYMVSHAIDSY